MPSDNMTTAAGAGDMAARLKRLTEHCLAYRGGDAGRSAAQLVLTAGLFLCALAAMFASFKAGLYGLQALLLPFTALLVVRLFIIQHDCGHGSFFPSRLANDWTGRALSLFTLIPYGMWRRAHNLHHAGSGSLARRGAGGIDTLTVMEYGALSPQKKLLYRIYRNPWFLLVLGPPVYILLLLRLPPLQKAPFLDYGSALPAAQSWKSVASLDAALAFFYGAAVWTLGWQAVLAVCLPVIVCAFWAGQWLFFVQHQYEGAYWRREKDWNYAEAAVFGSSWYDLPRALHWFTGNIGFHHIHHLCAAIPFYRLQECFRAHPDLRALARRLTVRESLKCVKLALWDEERGKLISFRDLNARAAAA